MSSKELRIRKMLLDIHKRKVQLQEEFDQAEDKEVIDVVIHMMNFVESLERMYLEELEVIHREQPVTESERILRQTINQSKAASAYKESSIRNNRGEG